MNHPNTVAAGGSTGLAVLIAWLAGHFGIADLGAEVSIVLAGLIVTTALFVGRRGVRGIARLIWRGDS